MARRRWTEEKRITREAVTWIHLMLQERGPMSTREIIDALESDLRAATEASATSAAPTADHDERVAELEQTIEQLRAAASSPAASGGGGAQTAIVLQTIRSVSYTHLTLPTSDLV